MPNLGEMLAGNIQREKQAAEDSAAAWEQMRTDEARQKFTTAKRFFDEARDFFTSSITNKEPVANLFRQVGGGRYGRQDVPKHPEFSAILDGYQHKNKDGIPDSLHDPKKFASLWHEFQQWARENGLIAQWQQEDDGGGMESWWVLRIKPAGTHTR